MKRLDEEILYYQNFDLNNLQTPVNVDQLELLLKQSHYDESETKFLCEGFRNGFDLSYAGPELIQMNSLNLKFTGGKSNAVALWNKVMKEVKLGRYAGPFREIPFNNYIQSLIGLVPKDGGGRR